MPPENEPMDRFEEERCTLEYRLVIKVETRLCGREVWSREELHAMFRALEDVRIRIV